MQVISSKGWSAAGARNRDLKRRDHIEGESFFLVVNPSEISTTSVADSADGARCKRAMTMVDSREWPKGLVRVR
jgi:hypothetical protein